MNNKEEEKKDLVEAIYEYQKSIGISKPDGIINKDGETYKQLKESMEE